MGAPPRRFAPARRAPGPREAKRAVRWKGRRMTAPATTAPSPDRGWFGHPRGLSTLFFTEMWERFSYYGMRGFLILYLTAAVTSGGMGFDDKLGAKIYPLYTSTVWLTPIVGGFIADRFLGQYRSVLIGGIIIALGHFTLAFHGVAFFYTGPPPIVICTGMFKPNVSTRVRSLYETSAQHRGTGFSPFY